MRRPLLLDLFCGAGAGKRETVTDAPSQYLPAMPTETAVKGKKFRERKGEA